MFKSLQKIDSTVNLSSLSSDQVKELQRALYCAGYRIKKIDGVYGKKTLAAWVEFSRENGLIGLGYINSICIERLQKKTDFSEILNLTYPQADEYGGENKTISNIIRVCQFFNINLPTQIAYILATTAWETNFTFRPVKEAFNFSEEWRKKNLEYYPFYGRGYVQLTWQSNYLIYSDILGKNIAENPDYALDPNISAFILVHGFKSGSFTGKRLSDFVNRNNVDFVGARQCINGNDRAHEIAGLTSKYLTINPSIL